MDRPPITPNMRIRDVIERYPQTLSVLHQYGIRCGDCHASRYESVGAGARVHDLDVQSLLTDLNTAARHTGNGGADLFRTTQR